MVTNQDLFDDILSKNSFEKSSLDSLYPVSPRSSPSNSLECTEVQKSKFRVDEPLYGDSLLNDEDEGKHIA